MANITRVFNCKHNLIEFLNNYLIGIGLFFYAVLPIVSKNEILQFYYIFTLFLIITLYLQEVLNHFIRGNGRIFLFVLINPLIFFCFLLVVTFLLLKYPILTDKVAIILVMFVMIVRYFVLYYKSVFHYVTFYYE